VIRNGKTFYRLYLYETKIIQEVHFSITALSEGGFTHTETDLILNVTCPSYAEVNSPTTAAYGTEMTSDLTRYVGAKGDYKTYTFPDFYPMEFEYCNFITSYTLASVDSAYSNYNNTIGSMYDFTSVEAPVGMSLLDTTITTVYDRLPVTKRKISVDTDYERSYSYNIMIELKLTKTTWADYLYSFSGTDH
jgi:hypothetical protein